MLIFESVEKLLKTHSKKVTEVQSFCYFIAVCERFRPITFLGELFCVFLTDVNLASNV
jgi:hypothetical protein